MISIDQTVNEVMDLLGRSASSAYFGEPVTQLEHALQSAQLARDSGSLDDMVIAALLHDIGHLLEAEGARKQEEVGVINHDDIGAEYLLERGFSPLVAELVRGHVDAKRYLTATNAGYARRLSEASAATLVLQGGPMNDAEVAAFQEDPLLADKLRLRSWDEQAKKVGWQVAPLESYRALLTAHLSE